MTSVRDTSEVRAVGEAFLTALSAHDFDALEEYLGPTMRMRTLLPTGQYEHHGSDEVKAMFVEWFATTRDVEVLETRLDTVGDRLTMAYRFRLRRMVQGPLKEIEQQAYCKVVDGKVVTIDMVCTGFRPADADVVSSDG
jgi:limonene-1,2-epoxide hydrolase